MHKILLLLYMSQEEEKSMLLNLHRVRYGYTHPATSEKYSLTENLHAKLKVPLACTLSASRCCIPLALSLSEYVISLVISL